MPQYVQDENWIRQCFVLAKRGSGLTSPNPLVGAVIVKEGKKISEGYHQHYGGHHAEVHAINNALRKKASLKGATIYINLEPCFHHGNTPPCVDALIRHKFKRVVVASLDPNPLVNGKSIQKLQRHGVECVTGVLEGESKKLNEKFFKFITSGLPFVSLKAAQTSDGFIAEKNGNSKWITNDESRRFVHRLRSEYDGILVGAKTVLQDDPLLTVRGIRRRNPIRIVIDGRLVLTPTKKIFNSDSSTIIYTVKSKAKEKQIEMFEKNGVAVVSLAGRNGKLNLKDVVEDLARHNISSIFVEGGRQMYSEFINAKFADKMYLFTARKTFGKGLPTFGEIRVPLLAKRESIMRFGSDICEEYSFSY